MSAHEVEMLLAAALFSTVPASAVALAAHLIRGRR